MTDTEYIQITHRELPYATFDADNHLYENRDALTKFLPAGVRGRRSSTSTSTAAPSSRSATRSPTTSRTRRSARWRCPAAPATTSPRAASGVRPTRRRGFGKLVAMPGIDAFFDPEPRLELMKEMGIDRTLLWPTLASVLEERVADDPDVACAP